MQRDKNTPKTVHFTTEEVRFRFLRLLSRKADPVPLTQHTIGKTPSTRCCEDQDNALLKKYDMSNAIYHPAGGHVLLITRALANLGTRIS